MDEFIVVIYETNVTNIPIEVRASWIKKMYPKVKVLYAYNPPMQYGLDSKSVKIQMDYLSKIIKDIKPTHFYSSEQYGKCVAEYLNIIDRRIDNKKEFIPICATIVRENIEDNKNWLDKKVYNDCKRLENFN